MTFRNLLTAFLALSMLIACKKNGTGGKNTIAAFPKHHGVSIPNSAVLIKYGAREFPGEDESLYDDKKIALKSGTEDAHAHFEYLLKGDYYLYSLGLDSAAGQVVKGGLSVRITSKEGETDLEIPVTE